MDLSAFFVGVDVGTGSARAVLIDGTGEILAQHEVLIKRQELKQDYITQSSKEIWTAVCRCVRKVVEGVDVEKVKGIGFDATCSLVALNADTLESVAVGPNWDDQDQDIILWMDHRAVKETAEINATNHKCLKYVGGQLSPEMDIPKIKWLKNHLKQELFDRCTFFDLPDYLTYRATGITKRSFCSTVCKQTLLPKGVENSVDGWSTDFFKQTDLTELTHHDYKMLGGSLASKNKMILSAGESVGKLAPIAAEQLGLHENCIVASSVIDAYAGWIGTVGADPTGNQEKGSTTIDDSIGRLASVAGTSTCHLTLSKDPIFVPGVWGPYRDVLISNYWCAEGGQSCTGELLNHILTTHPSYEQLCQQSTESNVSKFDYLNSILEYLMVKENLQSVLLLTKHLFLYGDYHGNRSPLAMPDMKATIIGQSMDSSIESLAKFYLVACEFIALQTRHIIETMIDAGHTINYIYMSGGQSRNALLMKLIANATNLPIIIPKYIDSAVVFGSAILGAVASVDHNNLEGDSNDRINMMWNVMQKLTPEGETVKPSEFDDIDKKLLNVKYEIFHDMIQTQIKYRKMVNDALI